MNRPLESHHSIIHNLQTMTIWRLAIISLVATWLWMIISIFGQSPEVAGAAMGVFFALLVGTALSYEITRRTPQWATACFIVNITVAITVAILFTGNRELLFLYAIPVLVAGAFIHPWVGLALALALDLLLVFALPALLKGTAPETLPSTFFLLTGSAAVLAWAFANDFHTVVDWMHQNYLLAEQRTQEARGHRARLHETLRSLDLAYYRLQRTNEALNWARWQAEEAQQAKARFAANVSHELRTPLNLVIGFSEMMVTAPESYGEVMPQTYRGDLNAIYRNAKHLSNLIDDVLDLSQIEAHRMPLNKEIGDLRQIVGEATNMIRGMVEVKGLMLSLILPAEPVPLFLDVTRIRQVVLNLLNNAARFTKNGSITVQLATQVERVTVTITDTGPGITPEKISQLFEEFYQVDDTIRREVGGTGLGLAISKHFVELHGGRIWAESMPGQGSAFSFSLPTILSAKGEMVQSLRDNRIVQTADNIERVLVILHVDAGAAAMIQRRLDTYKVVAVGSIDEMVEAVKRLRPTAVVVDTERRKEAKAVLTKALSWEVPLIGCPLPTPPKMAVQLQASDYLLKPVTRDVLARALLHQQESAKILISDDDPAMVRLLTRMVRSECPKAKILQAHHGQAALDIARRECPNLMLLDLRMPGVDGLDVLKQIRLDPNLSDMTVIVITATEMGEQKAELCGEMTVEVPQPLTVSEWLKMLEGVTTTLRPVPAPDGASVTMPATTFPG